MRQRSRFYGQSSYNIRGRVRETCRRWQRGHCNFEGECYFNHFEGPPQTRGRQPVLNQDSRQNIRDNPRPDTPVPNTQRSQTLRPESPDEAKPRNSVATPTKSIPSTLILTHTEETPPLVPTKEDDFISIDTNTGRKRYLKTECAILLQSIEENHQSYPSDSYMVLQIASKQLQERITICRSVEECWVYWKYRGRLDSKTASHWPLDAEDIDMEVMMPRRIKNGTTSSYAITSDQAALQIAPTAAMAQAIMPTAEASKLWLKEQKEFLCEVIKKKKNVQHRQSKEVFWQEVGENMAEAGYKQGYRMFRDYWDKHGRNEFQYDELPYFEREATPETIKQKRPIRRARPPGDRYTPDQMPPYDEDDDEYPPKSGLKSLSLRRREKGITARRRSLTPESPLKPIKNRKRLTTAGRNSLPTRPTKKRVPSTPPYRLPKAPVPQRIDSILHNMYSQYRVKDNTAKMASNFPLPLIAPATGEVLYPSLNSKEIAPSEPPHKDIQPVDRFISHDTPRESSTAKTLATQQILSFPAKNSQIPVKKVSSKAAAKDTKYNQPDSKSSARPAQDDFTKTAQSFDFRASPQKDFSASLERTQPASRPRSEKAATAKSTLETTAESNEQTKGGSIPSREEKEQAKSPSVASDSSDVSASTISQTQAEVEVAPSSVIGYTTDRYGNEHHFYQGENVTPHRNGTSNQDINQDITDYSDEDTIFVENNRTDGEVIAESEESTLIPSVTASARSCFSRTPSLSEDHSTTSDERMVNAPQPPRETSTDQADAGVFTEEMFQKELERTKSTISTMQHDSLKIKEENKETEKEIEDCQQKINTLTLARDVLKESHASNAAEIHRLEEKIESVETYKQATEILIECYKVKESKE